MANNAPIAESLAPNMGATPLEVPISGNIPATPEERRTNLEAGLEDVQSKERDFNSNKIINENKLKATKARLIQNLFQMMTDLGVDPTNLESINEFLQSLDQQDPDLRELFEVSFNSLIGDQDVNPQAPAPEVSGPVEENAGLFGRHEGLVNNIMQSRK